MEQLRRLRKVELSKVAEVADRSRWLSKTFGNKINKSVLQSFEQRLASSKLQEANLKLAMKGGLLTYLLHCEARVASFLGKGFYTIGPCGEELVGLSSLHLSEKDLVALHYRHVANSVTRQLMAQTDTKTIALNRARGFTCSVNDPVTGGKHCSIGGNPKNEFIVTSTLSSQCPPALGRALAIPYAQQLLGKESQFASDAISYVSVGDGSVSNAHFLSALNIAKYSIHNKIKCPLLFVITDNKISISLRNNGYVESFVNSLQGLEKETVNGGDFLDIHAKSGRLINYVRSVKRPALMYIKNLPRRFGHAATDRQAAYLSADEIATQTNTDPLSHTFSLLHELGVYKQDEIESLFGSLEREVEEAFNMASEEPKISSREQLIQTNTGPLVMDMHPSSRSAMRTVSPSASLSGPKEVMRKHMTRVYDELLTKHKDVVYVGEDVRHGGYYLVTEGLAAKHSSRVLDFPPDETSLMGVGVGLAQAGLTPIVEIPYAKYLDCGADMFYEAGIMHWLSNGTQPNGMIVRLQGFDRGIFGGNFHTHNMLNIFVPGVDVVCFSNGADYVRGVRYVHKQVKESKRMVVLVDSTDLLNKRHLDENKKDERMLSIYPEEEGGYDFDQVIVYLPTPTSPSSSPRKQIVIVTYGNGVPTSLQAQQTLTTLYPTHDVVVIDTPYLSSAPADLLTYLTTHASDIDSVVLADVCKAMPGMPLAKMAVDLHNQGLLGGKGGASSKGKGKGKSKSGSGENMQWRVVGAAPTYNPLGSYVTFLSVDDIVSAVKSMM